MFQNWGLIENSLFVFTEMPQRYLLRHGTWRSRTLRRHRAVCSGMYRNAGRRRSLAAPPWQHLPGSTTRRAAG